MSLFSTSIISVPQQSQLILIGKRLLIVIQSMTSWVWSLDIIGRIILESCLKTSQHSIFGIIRKIKNGYKYVGYRKLMILYTLWSNIFNIRIIIIIIDNKKNSIFDTESKMIHFIGSNKYIITKLKCWPVFKQDPNYSVVEFFVHLQLSFNISFLARY